MQPGGIQILHGFEQLPGSEETCEQRISLRVRTKRCLHSQMHEHTALSLHGNLAGERVPRHLDHTTQHEAFLCMTDMLASGKHQLSRQGAEGDTAVLGGSQGGCVFEQDCLSTRQHILASLKCCAISPSFSSRTQLAQLGNRLQQNRAHHRKSGLFELLKLKSAPPSSRKDV